MKKLERRPFALIGVNAIPHEPEELEQVMEHEGLPWRSFADQGAIVKRWNLSGTPTLYVIDAHGVIRFKWVGRPNDRVLDDALESVLRATEEAVEAPPR